MSIRINIKFYEELSEAQEQIFVDDTYKIYWELTNTCHKLARLKGTPYMWGLKFSNKKYAQNYERMADVAEMMYDNLIRCKEGSITEEDALFIFNREGDKKNNYYIIINETPFVKIKVNVLKKTNFATEMLKEYVKDFNKTIKKMRYNGLYSIEEYEIVKEGEVWEN